MDVFAEPRFVFSYFRPTVRLDVGLLLPLCLCSVGTGKRNVVLRRRLREMASVCVYLFRVVLTRFRLVLVFLHSPLLFVLFCFG